MLVRFLMTGRSVASLVCVYSVMYGEWIDRKVVYSVAEKYVTAEWKHIDVLKLRFIREKGPSTGMLCWPHKGSDIASVPHLASGGYAPTAPSTAPSTPTLINSEIFEKWIHDINSLTLSHNFANISRRRPLHQSRERTVRPYKTCI